MSDAELIRATLTAIALRDHDRLAQLRAKYEAHHPRGETEQLLHVAAVCVHRRFGAPATETAAATDTDQAEAGTETGPAPGPDPVELGRFLKEARTAGPGFTVPSNFLDLEGVIRGLLGEPDIIQHIDPTSMRRILTFLIQYLTDTTPELKEDFDTVIDQARQNLARELLS